MQPRYDEPVRGVALRMHPAASYGPEAGRFAVRRALLLHAAGNTVKTADWLRVLAGWSDVS